MYDYFKDLIKRLEKYRNTQCIENFRCDFTEISNALRGLMKMEFAVNSVPEHILHAIDNLEAILKISEDQFELTINHILDEINKIILKEESQKIYKEGFSEQIQVSGLKDLEVPLCEASFKGNDILLKLINSNVEYLIIPSGRNDYPWYVIKKTLVKE